MKEWITECGPEARAIPIGDPLLPATASIEDIGHAQPLRLQLRERYPDRPTSAALLFWGIGVD